MSTGSEDIEVAANGGLAVEPARRVNEAQRTMWQSLRHNPKVLFIAFFASYVALKLFFFYLFPKIIH